MTAMNTHHRIAKAGIYEQLHLGNEAMGKKGKPVSTPSARPVSNSDISMKHNEISSVAFPISHGFLIEHLYKGYKRYMVTPVTSIRVLYMCVRARMGASI